MKTCVLLVVYIISEIIFVRCQNYSWDEVSWCPRNNAEWIIASKRLNCSCDKQSCVYHCLRNEFKNSTLEGCAKAKPIVGQYCAEYNVFGKRINYNVNSPCGDEPCPCPVSYLSNETFKYPSCLLTEQNKGLCPNDSTHCLENETNTCVIPVLIAVVVMVLLWLVERSRVVQFLVLYCLECKRKKKTKDVESGGKDETDKMIKNDRYTVENPLPFDKDIQRCGYGYDSRRSSSSSEDDAVETLSGGPSMLSVSHFYTIVINIGIKFSAYGFSDNKSAVQLQSVGKRKTCKELSALLLVLNKTTGKIEFDSKTMSFGFDAREKYGKLKSQEERNSCSFFPNIKVEESDGKFVVKDIAGNERNAEEILKCLISCLRTMAIHRIKENRNLPEPTTDNTTYLVVSKFEIPQKKEILTNAAIQAGIPDEHLKIIKEADTYSLYLRQVKDNMNCLNCSLHDISKLMKVDDAYMVLDLGEGGANIVINVIKADETDVTKLHKYLEWGEESIRTRIIHVSVALFGQDCIDDLKEKHYSKYVGITEQIEHIKSKISLGEQGDITINLPSILDEIVKQKACQSLQNVVTTSTHKYAKYVTIHESEDNIKMEISPTILPLLLKPCIKKLIGCLQETASDEVGKVTFVYLIGGCANYKFMQEKVIKHFKNIPVILPSTPELVVVKGAPYHKDV